MIKRLKTADTDFAVYDSSTSDSDQRPLVMFVHGFPLDHRMWRFQIEALDQTHRVIVPDLAGFGDSSTSRESLSMEQMADDLDAILNQLKIDQPLTLCGLSMGGYVAWQFWKRHRTRLAKLIQVDTRSAADSKEVMRARKISAVSVIETGSEFVAFNMIPKLFSRHTRETQPLIAEQTHGVIAGSNPKSLAAGQLAMAARVDVTPWLAEIDLPTLVVVGQHDEITTPDEMKQMADRISGSRFEVIADAGHLAPLENPASFNEVLIEFLKS